MPLPADRLRADALAIWTAGVDAVRPERLLADAVAAFPQDWRDDLEHAPRVLVVGCGKAGGAMAAGLEAALPDAVPKMMGLVNVPEGVSRPLRTLRLHPARPAGSNHPTPAGVEGTDQMLRLLAAAEPDDVAICLISGGGSALLPAPADGLTLFDKQVATKHLHACGATIGEMNAVRKHLSRVKGGRLALAFRGRLLVSLIVSDVVGDPLDVIASGPTAPDPTTFADALAVLDRFNLMGSVPQAATRLLERGRRGEVPETAKRMPPNVHNLVIGSNQTALTASAVEAERRGYRMLNLGPCVEGESREVGVAAAGIARGLRGTGPTCVLIGGETTVALGDHPGKGGRNQEFVLAALAKLGRDGMAGVAVLSGGTDGEDGPTDAAGAVATADTAARAAESGLEPGPFLARHDSYPFFDKTDGLIRTGLTDTNVTDVRVVLVS